VQKSCIDAPQLGANMVTCRVDVDNMLGTANSGGPTTIVDHPLSSPAGATFAGRDPSSTFQCSTPAGGLPSAINCSFPSGLTFGNQSGNGGPVFLNFVVPPGVTLSNCATAAQTQNAGTRPDSNQANNTNICTRFTRPGVVNVTKSCTPGANHSTTCTVTVTNHTAAAIPTGTPVADTPSGAPAGLVYVGTGGNLTCPAAGPNNNVPVQCTTTSPIAANGGTATFIFAFHTAGAARFRNCAAIRSAPIAQGCTDVVTQ
jgi:hypothetical protein